MTVRDLLDLFIHAVLAIFGVSARELRFKDARKFKIARLVSDAIVATFGATIVFFISSMSGLPPQMGYITAGLVGWGGPQIIDRLFQKHVDIAKEEGSPKDEGGMPDGEVGGGEGGRETPTP